MAAQKIVIDTDIGTDADDSIAIALALASPELDLQAITVAGRQSFYRARIARRYLELAGRTDIKVFAGRDAPTPVPLGLTAATPIATLAGQNSKYHFNWFGNEGKGALADPPSENAETGLQRIFATDDNIGLVAIGPFTNIYQALSQSASSSPPGPMAQNIAQMAVMGIHIDPTPFGSAFISPSVDYNLDSDPVAALYCLNLSHLLAKTIWVTADVTLQTWMTGSDLERLSSSGSPFLQTLVREINAWTPVQERLFGYNQPGKQAIDNVAFLHDPLTVACVFDRSFCTFEQLNLEIVVDPNGNIRPVRHPSPDPNLSTMVSLNCATTVNAVQFREFLVDRLASFPWPQDRNTARA
jgi:purine nucleosidase